MYVFLWWKRARVGACSLPQPAYKDGTPIGGTGRGNKLLPNTTDWLGRWRMADNEANDWGMDREAQRSNAIYSGIDGIHLQDQAITESMGPIVDHTLRAPRPVGPDDHPHAAAAAAWRRARCATSGTLPPGVEDAERLSRRAQRLFRQRRPALVAGCLRQHAGRGSPSGERSRQPVIWRPSIYGLNCSARGTSREGWRTIR